MVAGNEQVIIDVEVEGQGQVTGKALDPQYSVNITPEGREIAINEDAVTWLLVRGFVAQREHYGYNLLLQSCEGHVGHLWKLLTTMVDGWYVVVGDRSVIERLMGDNRITRGTI